MKHCKLSFKTFKSRQIKALDLLWTKLSKFSAVDTLKLSSLVIKHSSTMIKKRLI
jgi:hypothetical protein